MTLDGDFTALDNQDIRSWFQTVNTCVYTSIRDECNSNALCRPGMAKVR